MAYSYILFDLDGTLTDSGPGIMNAAAYALKQFGIDEQDREKLRRFVGPPLSDAFPELYGIADVNEAIRQFRVYYRPIGIFENAPYPGIGECLAELKRRGKKLAVATSKPLEMAEQVLKRFGLWDYFDVVCGATLDESRNRKPEIVSDALAALDVQDKSQAIMVGDRGQDVLGARENGIACVGILWGYGSREELSGAGADWIAANYDELYAAVGASDQKPT